MKNQSKQLHDFVNTWSTHGNEVTDKVHYWDSLLHILGVPQQQLNDGSFIEYEKTIKLKAEEHFHGSIDAYIPKAHVLIEQKSFGVDLFKPESRPNGGDKTPITPHDQARRYDDHLPANEKSHFLVLSNFSKIVIYDVRESLDKKPTIIDIKDLPDQLYLLKFLTGETSTPKLEKEKMFMYPELVEAHEENDKAVLEAYGLTSDATEIEIIKYLFKIYEDKVESK